MVEEGLKKPALHVSLAVLGEFDLHPSSVPVADLDDREVEFADNGSAWLGCSQDGNAGRNGRHVMVDVHILRPLGRDIGGIEIALRIEAATQGQHPAQGLPQQRVGRLGSPDFLEGLEPFVSAGGQLDLGVKCSLDGPNVVAGYGDLQLRPESKELRVGGALIDRHQLGLGQEQSRSE